MDLAEQAALEWNGLSPTMKLLISRPGDQELWQQAKAQGESIFETEYTLFNFLGDTVLRDTGA